eukprot:gene10707-12408_t
MQQPHEVPQEQGQEDSPELAAFFHGAGGGCVRYTPVSICGKGAYGLVCAARDNATGQMVAIKKIPKLYANRSDATRILREITLLRLLKNEDIVELHYILLPPDLKRYEDLYVVFELFESDLHTVIGANDDLSADHQKVFLYQMLRGLNFIHQSGVLHRDLKPKNILANSNCRLKICDFGLARLLPSTNSLTPVNWTDYVATRWYRAPELCGVFYGHYSQAVDVWSMGCIFAEILLGRPLFPGRDAESQLQLITDLVGKPDVETIRLVSNAKARNWLQMMPNKPSRWESRFPGVDPDAVALLKEMLAFNPSMRTTAEEALAHPYFQQLPKPPMEGINFVGAEHFKFDKNPDPRIPATYTEDVRELINQEILKYHPHARELYMNGMLPVVNAGLVDQYGSYTMQASLPLQAPPAEQPQQVAFQTPQHQTPTQPQLRQDNLGAGSTHPQHYPGAGSTHPQHNPGAGSTHPQHYPGAGSTHPQHYVGAGSTNPQHYPGAGSTHPQHYPGAGSTYPQHNPGARSTYPQGHPGAGFVYPPAEHSMYHQQQHDPQHYRRDEAHLPGRHEQHNEEGLRAGASAVQVPLSQAVGMHTDSPQYYSNPEYADSLAVLKSDSPK